MKNYLNQGYGWSLCPLCSGLLSIIYAFYLNQKEKIHSSYGLRVQCGEEESERHEETLIVDLIAGGGKVSVAFIDYH